MRFYHRTSQPAAKSILAGGFRDAFARWFGDWQLVGVWVSQVPLDCNEGAGPADESTGPSVLLAIDGIDESDLAKFEVLEDGKPYREWCAPATILNGGTVIEVDEDNEPSRLFEGDARS